MGNGRKLTTGLDFVERVAASAELRSKYGPLPQQSKGRILESFLFGILTATERTESAERALQALQLALYPRNIPAVRDILADSGIIYWAQKSRFVVDFLQRYDADPSLFAPKEKESASEYRDRIHNDVRVLGLGFVKASFATYLAYGGGDVICVDRHIIHIVTGAPVESWMFKATKRAHSFLRSIEDTFVQLATTYEWPSASALQWAVWCESMGLFFNHAIVSQ